MLLCSCWPQLLVDCWHIVLLSVCVLSLSDRASHVLDWVWLSSALFLECYCTQVSFFLNLNCLSERQVCVHFPHFHEDCTINRKNITVRPISKWLTRFCFTVHSGHAAFTCCLICFTTIPVALSITLTRCTAKHAINSTLRQAAQSSSSFLFVIHSAPLSVTVTIVTRRGVGTCRTNREEADRNRLESLLGGVRRKHERHWGKSRWREWCCTRTDKRSTSQDL